MVQRREKREGIIIIYFCKVTRHFCFAARECQLVRPPSILYEYRRRWKYIQHLVDKFWKRWTREYLPTIQHRRKWVKDAPNAHIGDIVLIMDELTHRNQWAMGRVVRVNHGRDGNVRSWELKTQKGRCTRPVAKLCLLELSD